ncbi:MAG TPA: dehydrogenase [Bacteroidales bacterium]|nr:dehydrogenase [Bacteroidales bacterium]
MIIRSKAPLRLGLAGGGSDVSPYCDLYGGCVLNATIDLYAYCTLKPAFNGKIFIHAIDRNESFTCESINNIPADGCLALHKGVYNRLVKDFSLKPLAFELYTWTDAPAGSGLGSSSTIVVAILQAFVEWLNLPLGDYDIAQLAYDIERKDIGLCGGKQDQYAATFGGFNFIEFYDHDRVIVNPLKIKDKVICELEASMLLFDTGVSRASATIIENQMNVLNFNGQRLNAMHQIKASSYIIKETVLKGDFPRLFDAIRTAWAAKKGTSDMVSNKNIEEIYDLAIGSGAHCGKISGAGGGGFMMLFVDPVKKLNVIRALSGRNGRFVNFHFVNTGSYSWRSVE